MIMRKTAISFLLLLAGLTAGAQNKAQWNAEPVNHLDFYYNYNLGTPEALSHSGWGLSFPIYQVQYVSANERNMLTLDFVNLSMDFLFPQKGHLFGEDGSIVTAPDSFSKLKSRIYNLGITLPIGYAHQFGNGWGAGLSVAPGIDRAEFINDYVDGDIRYSHTYSKNSRYIGFRLDAVAAVWYYGIGLTFRYRPFSYLNQAGEKTGGVISAGISFRY